MAGISENSAISWRLQAAYVMDRYPLCDYRIQESSGQYVMDALLFGDDYMGDAFFSNMLSGTRFCQKSSRGSNRKSTGGSPDKPLRRKKKDFAAEETTLREECSRTPEWKRFSRIFWKTNGSPALHCRATGRQAAS